MVDMTYVDSSNVEAIGYDPTGQELHVQFRSGGYYVYSSVPPEVYDGLLNSASKGSFLNRQIKNVYPFRKES